MDRVRSDVEVLTSFESFSYGTVGSQLTSVGYPKSSVSLQCIGMVKAGPEAHSYLRSAFIPRLWCVQSTCMQPVRYELGGRERKLGGAAMFSLIMGFWKMLFKKSEYQVLIVGIDYAGKTVCGHAVPNADVRAHASPVGVLAHAVLSECARADQEQR